MTIKNEKTNVQNETLVMRAECMRSEVPLVFAQSICLLDSASSKIDDWVSIAKQINISRDYCLKMIDKMVSLPENYKHSLKLYRYGLQQSNFDFWLFVPRQGNYTIINAPGLRIVEGLYHDAQRVD